MKTPAALPAWILGGALVVGVVADLLLRSLPWGINVTLCTVLLLGVGAALVRYRRLPVSTEARWLTLTALLLALAFARRDSRMLAASDLLALIVTLGLTAAALRGARLARLNLLDQAMQVAASAAYSLIGTLPLLGRIARWMQEPRSTAAWRIRSVILGTVIATPLLLVFGSLFAGADPLFGRALRGVLAVDPGVLASHAFPITFFTGISAGYLSWAILRPPGIPARIPVAFRSPVGAAPVLTALTLTAGLFALFVAFQAAELFGGAAWVQGAAGPSYAGYARSGFFELLLAAALVLPLLLGADRALVSHVGSEGRWFRVLARTLLALLFVIIASALNRMRLYVAAYGLSEIRLYATAAMGYLAFLAAWLAARVIRMRRRRFAPGALVAGYVALSGLNLLNPDALIVRANLSRITSHPFDARYAASLSSDAVPTLVDRLPELDPRTRCQVEIALRKRWAGTLADGLFPLEPDWRSLNWSRWMEIRVARRVARFARLTNCIDSEAP